MNKVIKVFKAILGAILMFGIFLPLYIADRAICVPMFWIESKTALSWYKADKEMTFSIIRVGVVAFISWLVWLFV